MPQLFDDEVMGPLVGSLAGTVEAPDPLDEFKSDLNVWADKRWLLPGRMPQRDPLSRLIHQNFDGAGPGDKHADDWARQRGVDVTSPDTDLLSLARSQIGSPYVWATLNPEGPEGGSGSGFDCSGFTKWVLSRFGIETQHMASLQQQQFAHVTREQLQPGDLIFYNYGRKGPGVADHVAIYIGNGKQIAASSSAGIVTEQSVDWDNFIGGGATGIDAGSATSGTAGGSRRRHRFKQGDTATPLYDLSQVPHSLAGGGYGMDQVISTYGGMMADLIIPEEPKGAPRRSFNGRHGRVNRQLYQGFIDAGRPDLAKMVGTPAFNAWVNAESGWNVHVTSAANNNGLANDGLFQIWRGHSFNSNGQVSGMSPYEQAQIVTQYFDLTPEDILRYYDQIKAGSYHGWG